MALPQTGVTLVAAGAPQFQSDMAAAQSAVDSFGASAGGAASQGLTAFGNAAAAGTSFLGNLGGALQSSLGVFGSFASGVANFLSPIGDLFDLVVRRIERLLVGQALRAVEQFIGGLITAATKGSELDTALGRLQTTLDNVSKVSLSPLVDQLGKIADKAGPAIAGFVQAAETQFSNLATNAFTWGSNVVTQFANGMWAAVGQVLDALTAIAEQIAYFLAPGSPPRILPKLDQWGTDAANEFLSGWSKADFSVFNDLSSTLTSLIQSLPVGIGKGGQANQVGLIDRVLGTREGIAQAVEELQTAGTISQSTINQITASVGTASASVRDFLVSTIKLQAANQGVAAAQANLNAVTKTYQDLLKPVDAQIAGITEAQ